MLYPKMIISPSMRIRGSGYYLQDEMHVNVQCDFGAQCPLGGAVLSKLADAHTHTPGLPSGAEADLTRSL